MKFTAVCIAFAFGSILPNAAQADLLDRLAGSTISKSIDDLNRIAEIRISQLIDGFDRTSKSLLVEGANEGNLLLIQGGNQMQLAIASARAQFGIEMNNQVGQASAQLKPFLIELNRLQQSIAQMKENIIDLEDLIALDIQDIPFTKAYFGVRRVLGTVIVQNNSDTYPIVFRGPHFGTVEAGETIGFEVSLDSVPLHGPELGSSPTDAVFRVPADMLKSKFRQKELVTLLLKVKISRSTKYLGIFPSQTDVIEHEFAVSLLPDYAGELKVVTTRPVFDWKPVLPPEIQDHTVIGPYTFSYGVANPSLLSTPNPGEQKVGEPIGKVCHENLRAARQFPNGRKEFADASFFRDGWRTDKYIGAKETDWEDADKEILAKWGFRWNTWRENACGSLNSKINCLVRSDVLIANSFETIKDATGCYKTKANEQWRNNHTSAIVNIVGGDPKEPSPWTITFQPLSYIQIGTKIEPAQTYAIFTSKHTQIDITDPHNTSTELIFLPFVGVKRTGYLGRDIPRGPRFDGSNRIGNLERSFYSFKYPSGI